MNDIKEEIKTKLLESYKDGWEACAEFIENTLKEVAQRIGAYPNMEIFIKEILPSIKSSVKEIVDE